MLEFYKKLHNGEIKIGENTQLTDNEWLAFAVYYEFSRFVDWQNMAYHLEQTINGEDGGCARIICFYANHFYNSPNKQNEETNKKKKFTLKSPKTRELIRQYACDYLDFDIELDYEDLNEKTE
jgi:hypothetical protein